MESEKMEQVPEASKVKEEDFEDMQETSGSEEEEKTSDNSDEWTEIDQEGWENILGSGRLRRKIISASQVQEVRPVKGDQVTVSFKGTFQGKEFEVHEKLIFNCDEGEVIRALDLVVALMHPGEIDDIIADPDLAYGDFGFPPHLPAKAAVEIQVQLLDIKPHESPLALPLEERQNIGQRKKDRGNFWFSHCDYSMAVQCYRKAVEYFDDESIEIEVAMDRYLLPQPMQDLIAEKIKACNNLAQAQLKLQAFDSALASLKNVLKLDPNNEKALFRKAKALAAKGETELAIGTLRRVTRLYQENKEAQKDLQRLLAQQAQYNAKAKNISKKMLGLDKYEEEQEAKKKAQKRRNLVTTSVFFACLAGAGAILATNYYVAFQSTN